MAASISVDINLFVIAHETHLNANVAPPSPTVIQGAHGRKVKSISKSAKNKQTLKLEDGGPKAQQAITKGYDEHEMGCSEDDSGNHDEQHDDDNGDKHDRGPPITGHVESQQHDVLCKLVFALYHVLGIRAGCRC